MSNPLTGTNSSLGNESSSRVTVWAGLCKEQEFTIKQTGGNYNINLTLYRRWTLSIEWSGLFPPRRTRWESSWTPGGEGWHTKQTHTGPQRAAEPTQKAYETTLLCPYTLILTDNSLYMMISQRNVSFSWRAVKKLKPHVKTTKG